MADDIQIDAAGAMLSHMHIQKAMEEMSDKIGRVMKSLDLHIYAPPPQKYAYQLEGNDFFAFAFDVDEATKANEPLPIRETTFGIRWHDELSMPTDELVIEFPKVVRARITHLYVGRLPQGKELESAHGSQS